MMHILSFNKDLRQALFGILCFLGMVVMLHFYIQQSNINDTHFIDAHHESIDMPVQWQVNLKEHLFRH
ncbi:hypothetical protein VII00023_06352 [Vibrio ichthyoenteri ATCC 700023]|uniref:Uncharacterized protein n=1 Tax=Vibrio ichthyoenteri ATCC 700023 TaxID=870968 RepID=F9S1R2_9VIBR|nr:hypothetical protein [Vibrio ichthyoenteri]EGU41454.1 hypothetical protein VII00023_06352 [Vibrio ichthyoenteri ATCC 700023]